MHSYARVENGLVMEIFKTGEPIGTLFHSALTWIRIPDNEAAALEWRFDGKSFSPPASQLHVEEAPSLASILTELMAVQTELAALKKA